MKIAAKIRLGFMAVGVAAAIVGSLVFYSVTKTSITDLIVAHLETAAESRKDHIETYLKMVEISVGQLSKSVVLENCLKTKKDDPAWSKNLDIATKRLDRTKEVNSSVSEFLLLDESGKVVASSDKASIGIDKSSDALFLGGQKGIYIKDAYFSETKKEPLMAVSAPIVSSSTGEPLGVLVARVRLDDLNRIVTDDTGMGNTGEIYIVNKFGYMITPSRHLKDTFLKKKIDTQNLRMSILPHGDGHRNESLDIFSDYRGLMVLGTHEYLPKMQWSILAEINADEAFEPLTKIRNVILFILLLIPLVAWVAGTIISEAITKPIHKLHKGTEIIGGGNLDYKVGTPVKDEIGQLSRAFDTMTADLKKKIVSIDSLNKEIVEREAAENRLAKNEERTRKIAGLEASLLDPGTMGAKLKKITDSVVEIFDADFCRIWFISPGDRCGSGCVHAAATEGPHVCRFREQCLHLVASSGRYTHTDGGAHARVPFGCYKIGGIASGEYPSFLTNDVQHDPRVHNHDWAKELGLISFAGFQLRPPHGEVSGVMALFSCHAISTEEFAALEGISSVAISVIQAAAKEDEVRESELKFKTLYGSSADAIMILTPEGRYLSGNPASIKLFNCEDEAELMALGPVELSTEYQPDGKLSSVKAKEIIAATIKEGSNFFEWTHKKITGEEFFATVLLTRMEVGGKIILQATVRDVTEQKMNAELAENAAKSWAATFDAMIEGVSIHDADFDLLNLNDALCQILGQKKENVIGKRCHQLFHGKNTPIQGCPLEKAKVTGKKEHVEVFESFLGRWLAVSVSPIYDDSGQIVRFVHVVSDITKQKNMEKMKDEFVSTVSHELRTPLTAIKESIGIVLDGSAGSVNDEQKDFLDTAKRNVDRLSRLINDILDYQKLEAGKTVFRNQKVDMRQLADEVVGAMMPVAKSKNLYLETRVDPEIPVAIFDKDKIIQVMINLINNAIKFTDQGGITVTISRDGGSLLVSVKDTGVGIKKEDLPKLFQDFTQLDEGRARKKGSTGLGLAISKRIVEDQGGQVWAESEYGKGTDFRFRLPLRIKFKILLIDDNVDLLSVCTKSLENAGYEVASSENGLPAMSMIEKDKPDIVILDMRLKDINGYEMIGRLRSDKATAMIPILAMSGYPEELVKLGDRRDDSALLSISKPFHANDFLIAIRSLLKQEV